MVANVTHSCTSHIQTTPDIFWLIWRPWPNLSCVKIWRQFLQQELRYGPKCDFTKMFELWPWKVKVIHKRQTICYQTAATSNYVKFHRNLIASFSVTVEQSLTEIDWKEARGKKNKGETIWHTLALCDANYTMKEWWHTNDVYNLQISS